MYKVVRYFTDLQDNNYEYRVGDTYPREGLEPTEERIQELASDKNKQNAILIQAVSETSEVVEEETEEKPKSKRKRKSSEE